MNFLVIGSGAREHIIAEKLFESGSTVYSVLTNLNPGLLKLSADYHSVTTYNSRDSQTSILNFARENSVRCVSIFHLMASGFAVLHRRNWINMTDVI